MELKEFHLLYYSMILFFSIFNIFLRRKFNQNSQRVLVYAFISIISLFVGFRDINIGSDTPTYLAIFNNVTEKNTIFFEEDFSFGTDPGFYFLVKIFSLIGSFRLFLVFIAFATNILLYRFCISISKTVSLCSSYHIVTYILLITSFIVFNMEINIIRSGLGMALLLNSIFYLFLGDKKKFLLFGIIAVSIHFSMAIFLTIAILIKITKIDLKYFYYLYLFSLAVSFIGMGILDFIPLERMNLRAAKLYTETGLFEYKTGFRPTFALFNSLFLLFFSYYMQKSKALYNIVTIDFLKYYIASSSLFFLWFVMPFSDRIGAFSWIVIPILTTCIFFNGKFHPRLRYQLFFIGYFIICFIISSLNV